MGITGRPVYINGGGPPRKTRRIAMETTQVLTPEAPQSPKKKLPSFHLPKGRKGRKWVRRIVILAVVALGEIGRAHV